MFSKSVFARLIHWRQNSILSASIVLAVTFGLSALLGLLRSKFLYARFFSCCVLDLDAYNAAFRIPDLIFKLLVTGALSASFIPVFSSSLHKDKKQANLMASSVINLLLVSFTVLSVLALIFTPALSGFIAAGFKPQQIELMTQLTRILLIAQIFFLISNFLTGILQVHQIFFLPSLSPIVYNIFIILSIYTLAPRYGIYGVVYGTVVGAFFHMAIQIPSAIHSGFKYSFSFNTRLTGVKEIIRLMVPRTLSLGLGEIENTVTLFFASNLAAGSLSILNLAIQIMYLPSRIFATTVGQASLPILSKNIARNELDIFRETVRKTILQSIFIAAPISALILVNRLSIIRLAYGAKQFPWSATVETAQTLAFLVPAIATQAIIQILTRCFYAVHNTRVPLVIAAISLISTVLSSYYFVYLTNMGVLGLAIADSIGNVAQTVGLVYMFIKIVDGTGWDLVLYRVLRITLASVIMGFATWLSLRFLDLFVFNTTHTFSLLVLFSVSSLFGIVVFYFACRLLKVKEIEDYQRLFGNFIAKFTRQPAPQAV